MSLGLVRPCQVSFTASKTRSTAPSQAAARSTSGARNMMAGTQVMPSVAKKAQVGAVRPHARAVAHGDAHAREQRLLVALAKWLEHLQGTDGLHRELREADGGRDLSGVLELLGGKVRKGGLEAPTELVQARGLAGHAHGPRVAAKAHEHVGALLHGVEEVDLRRR